MFRLGQSRLVREPAGSVPQDLPSLDSDRDRHRQSAILPARHGEAEQQQGGREAQPAADPSHRLRRAPEPSAPRRALRHLRGRRVAAPRRRRRARPRARTRDRAQPRSRAQAVPQGRRHPEERDRAQETCAGRASHSKRYLRIGHAVTAFWHGAVGFARHERWCGHCRWCGHVGYRCGYE